MKKTAPATPGKNNARRDVMRLAAIAATSALLPKSVMAATPSPQPLIYSTGFIGAPATYYDVIEPAGGSTKPPLVLIHGGLHTGGCYSSTPDGRQGWAQSFAARGYKVVLPDWPGCGRSAYIPQEKITGEAVCEGLGNVIASLGRPAIVLTHSISGGYGWPLLEKYGQHIERLVAVAPGEPGNMQPVAAILSRNGDVVEAQRAFAATKYMIDLKQPYVPTRDMIDTKLIGKSKRFPRAYADKYAASLISLPSRLLYERLNIAGSQLKVSDFTHFRGKRIVVLVGTDDVDHAGDSDKRISDWLNQNGAKAEFISLGTKGINGNGHMMMIEENNDEIAGFIAGWIEGA